MFYAHPGWSRGRGCSIPNSDLHHQHHISEGSIPLKSDSGIRHHTSPVEGRSGICCNKAGTEVMSSPGDESDKNKILWNWQKAVRSRIAVVLVTLALKVKWAKFTPKHMPKFQGSHSTLQQLSSWSCERLFTGWKFSWSPTNLEHWLTLRPYYLSNIFFHPPQVIHKSMDPM